MEIRNSAVTLLLVAMLIPEALLFIAHFFKSIFGSQPWPTMRIILMVRDGQSGLLQTSHGIGRLSLSATRLF